MSFYRKDQVRDYHRSTVRAALDGLDALSQPAAARVVEAWSVMWSSSEFSTLNDIPVSPSVPYSLIAHTNDVVRIGRSLAAAGAGLVSGTFDPELLIEILLVHDIDKMLLFAPKDRGVFPSDLSGKMAHGVVAGLVLNDLGFRDDVISIVTTHATDAPFHVSSIYGLITYYADMAAIDLVLLRCGGTPFYRR
ncbi:hydrolase [Rhizobium sp. 16-449-1b]|uniref:hydrolase n=1 Tax=Rhizobium sp. 16-449-1b TaxID=2819989 RepID=UPI001ADAB8C2|nr:hydrolase [Rhizobium sp. 16-449-1b]MBO9197522.1 hydrolase [Rhizobium sp. 16-449-1b]